MLRRTLFAPLLAASAMALALATPAQAGKADRARDAIAAADAKIYTAEAMGAGSELPHQAADARAALAMAREDLSAGRKSNSIAHAIRASSLADAATGEMQRHHDRAMAEERQSRDSVAAAQQQTAFAQQQAASAQQQTVEANTRANVAQQSAALSASDAAAARNAAMMAAQTQPAQVETVVTTDQPARTAARHSTRSHTTTTRSTTAPAAALTDGVTTTTTVTQPTR